jgi:fructokinase
VVVIVVVGEALVDLVIDPSGGVTAALGGAPFNTARACGRLGMDVAFVGSVSVDRFGSMLVAQLQADGVSTDHVTRVDVPTTLAAAELDEHGAAQYRFYIEGTSAPALSDPPLDLGGEVLFTGGLGLVLEPMSESIERMVAAHSDRAMVMIDVNCRPRIIPDRDAYVARVRRMVERAHIVKVSDEDLAYLWPDHGPLAAARLLLERGPRAVLLTAGGEGVQIITQESAESVPVQPVDVIDTIGAGDSFGGGFLSSWLASGAGVADTDDVDRLRRAVEAANVVAGIVCTRRGADPPWHSELPDEWWS